MAKMARPLQTRSRERNRAEQSEIEALQSMSRASPGCPTGTVVASKSANRTQPAGHIGGNNATGRRAFTQSLARGSADLWWLRRQLVQRKVAALPERGRDASLP